jgi:2-phospho-L-lactate guanylyltransferase (CobY/MobA/RfbA family)
MPIPAILLFLKMPGEETRGLTALSQTMDGERDRKRASDAVESCLLQDAIRQAKQCLPLDGCLIIVGTPGAPGTPDTAIKEPGIDLELRGGHPSEQLIHAVCDAAFDRELSPLVLIGTDYPLLSPETITTAFRLLLSDVREGDQSADVVVGPSENGGFYLLGLRDQDQAIPLLSRVAWGTERVFAHLTANADRLRLWVYANLPTCYRISTPADLARLRADLKTDPDLRENLPALADWLSKNTENTENTN